MTVKQLGDVLILQLGLYLGIVSSSVSVMFQNVERRITADLISVQAVTSFKSLKLVGEGAPSAIRSLA